MNANRAMACLWAMSAAACIGLASMAAALEPLTRCIPSGASIYVEVASLGSAIERFERSELLKSLTSLPQWQAYLESPDYQRLAAGRKLLETHLGQDVLEAVKSLVGKRIAVGIYPRERSKQADVVVVLQVGDERMLGRIRDQADQFSRLLGPGLLRSDGKVEQAWVWSVQEKVFFVSKDDWLIVATARKLAEESALLMQGKGREATALMQIHQAMAKLPGNSLVRVYADLAQLAKSSGDKREPVKFDNVVAAWLFGGVAEAARTAPWACMSLSIGEKSVDLTVQTPVDWRELEKSAKGYFLGPDESAPPVVADLPSSMIGFSMQRDFVHLYKSREGNLQSQILPEFDKFETGLSNLMPGRSFSEDILPLLGRKLSVVVGKQRFADPSVTPAIQLPGFAVVVEPDDAEKAADLFQLIFQSLVAVLNFQAGERGGEPMVIRAEIHNGVPISFGKLMNEAGKGGEKPMSFNFTPASARVGNRLILSSSVDFCRQLVDRLSKPPAAGSQDRVNASFVARADGIADGLESNRSFLEAKIVQSGKTAKQASLDFSLGLKLLRMLDELRADGIVQPDGYQLRLGLSWK